MRSYSGRPPHKPNESVTRLLGTCGWARLVRSTGAVDFSRRDACEPDTRSFGAPDGSVAIPNMRRCASEGLARWNNSNRCQEKQPYHSATKALTA